MQIADVDEARPGGSDVDLRAALDEATDALRRSVGDGDVTVVPDSLDVGYRVSTDSAVTVARQDVEIRTGDYAIRRIVEIVL